MINESEEYVNAIMYWSFFNKSTVSSENVDIVVKAPSSPTPRNKTASLDTMLLIAMTDSIPSINDPTTFTNNVGQGSD